MNQNGPAASKSWNVAAEYVVRCLVSDMKGGLAAASQIVQIGSPATFRISGRVTVDGTPLVNARVYVSDGLYGQRWRLHNRWSGEKHKYGQREPLRLFLPPIRVNDQSTLSSE